VGTPSRVHQLRKEAVTLRLAGKSLREIKDAVGPVGNRTLSVALHGTPPAGWTLRPNAKDDLREKARQLRRQGLSYNQIVVELGVSKSSVSLWVRDIPCPERFKYVHNERRYEGLRKFNEARSARHAAETEIAAAEIFLRFLEVAGVQTDDLIFRVHIHENADAEAAQWFWLEVTGAQPSQFRSPTLKHHNPNTRRTNVGDSYHGCLRVDVRRSAELYRKIEGWASAAMTPGAPNAAQGEPVSW
jgi:transcriptional regulator with XRE-family HTH domain